MKAACRAFAGGQLPQAVAHGLPAGFAVPDELKDVARYFVVLQEQRHLADYDLALNPTRAEAHALVQLAEQAVVQFEQWADRDLKKFFLACLNDMEDSRASRLNRRRTDIGENPGSSWSPNNTRRLW